LDAAEHLIWDHACPLGTAFTVAISTGWRTNVLIRFRAGEMDRHRHHLALTQRVTGLVAVAVWIAGKSIRRNDLADDAAMRSRLFPRLRKLLA
jgi:hypothetical protein